ncbi:hypothetical protein [Amycolatopsis sp. RTGN1]|uniref:hypothetical protein n=1 Tax=Amycolatopsis ponsaeliensis TaxID=2992142 RepID=UPI00254F62DE|nr:hypothetical protein [Amycolatopsis sp. RTGN1]
MERQATWRALAVTYGVVAVIQLYLAIVMNATWAGVLATVCGAAAVSFMIAAGRRRIPEPDDGAAVQHAGRPAVTSTPPSATSPYDHPG